MRKLAKMVGAVLLTVIGLWGCSKAESQTTTPTLPLAELTKIQEGKHRWVKYHGWLPPEYKWVCKTSGRIDDGLVTPGDQAWEAFVRGEKYGSFGTREEAETQVELVFTAKGFQCPD